MLSLKKQIEPLKTERIEFSKKIKAQAFLRAGGRCEECGTHLTQSNTEYDHTIPCGNGGDASLSNCQCLCGACHQKKTKSDVAAIAKTKRIYNKTNGIQTRKHKAKIPSRPLPGTKASGWKKSLDGKVERRQSKGEQL